MLNKFNLNIHRCSITPSSSQTHLLMLTCQDTLYSLSFCYATFYILLSLTDFLVFIPPILTHFKCLLVLLLFNSIFFHSSVPKFKDFLIFIIHSPILIHFMLNCEDWKCKIAGNFIIIFPFSLFNSSLLLFFFSIHHTFPSHHILCHINFDNSKWHFIRRYYQEIGPRVSDMPLLSSCSLLLKGLSQSENGRHTYMNIKKSSILREEKKSTDARPIAAATNPLMLCTPSRFSTEDDDIACK